METLKSCIFLIGGWVLFLLAQKKENWSSKKLAYALVIFMLTAFTLINEGSPDIYYYQYQYKAEIYDMAFLYDALAMFFLAFGFDFVIFKAFLGAICIFFLYKSIAKCTNNVALVLSLIWIFPFRGSIVQLRNGVSAAIVLYAVVLLLKENRHSILKFCLFVILASLFHPSALFYFFLLPVKFVRKIPAKWRIAIPIALALFIHICITFNLVYEIANWLIPNTRYSSYFDFSEPVPEDVLNWKGKAVPIIGQTMGYLAFYFVFKQLKKHIQTNTAQKLISKQRYFSAKQLDMIQFAFLLLFVLLPLYLRSPTFFRLFKNLIPLIHIVDAQYLSFAQESRLDVKRSNYLHYYVAGCTFLAQAAMLYCNGMSIFGGYARFLIF